MSILKTKYRITRDWYDSRYWMVQKKVWWCPIWIEHRGLLRSKEESAELIAIVQQEYRA